MPPYIPPEITDEIISYVELDFHIRPKIYHTLLACALVSRDWFPASRCRLLQDVKIKNTSAYNAFVNNVLRAPHMEPWLAEVKAVWLWENDLPQQDGKPQGLTCRFTIDFVSHLLPNFKPKCLGIRDADWNTRPPHPRFHLALSRLSSITLLHLQQCKLPSAQMLRRMVYALSSSLRQLFLKQVTWPPARGGMLATYTAVPVSGPAWRLLRVEFDDDCIASFLRWLQHTPTQKSLRYLHFIKAHDLESLADDVYIAFFQAVAAGLITVHIQHEMLRKFSFHNLSSLRYLKLYVYPGHWSSTASLFGGLPSGARIFQVEVIQVLKNFGQTYSPSLIAQDGLELMEPLLQGDRFAELEGIDLDVEGGKMNKSKAATVEAQLDEVVERKIPSAVSKGLISVNLKRY